MIVAKKIRRVEMGTYVVGIIVAVVVFCAARSIYKDRKAGKCSGGCSGCSGCAQNCPSHRRQEG